MKKQENETKHPSHEVSTMDIVYEALNNSVELQASFFHSLATGLLLLQFFLCHSALTLHNFLLTASESWTEERQHSSICIHSCVTTALEKSSTWTMLLSHCLQCKIKKNPYNLLGIQWVSATSAHDNICVLLLFLHLISQSNILPVVEKVIIIFMSLYHLT